MKTDIQNITQLMLTAKNGKYKKYLPTEKSFVVKSFDSLQEYIFDIYSVRWKNNKQQSNNIFGLEEFVKELGKTNINTIRTTIFNKKNEKITIFTDKDYKELIGLLLFTKSANE